MAESSRSRSSRSVTSALAPGARAEEIPPATLLLNCPSDHDATDGAALARARITAISHWEQDPSGRRPLKAHFRGLAAMLPLMPGQGGLLVFTQDRGVARRLDEQVARLEQEWLVEVRGTLDEKQMEALRRGSAVPGRRLAPGKVSWQSETRLRIALKGMVPGQLEAMCTGVGLTVSSVKRLRIGGVSLGRVPTVALPAARRALLRHGASRFPRLHSLCMLIVSHPCRAAQPVGIDL